MAEFHRNSVNRGTKAARVNSIRITKPVNLLQLITVCMVSGFVIVGDFPWTVHSYREVYSSHCVPCVASHVVTLISSHCVPCVASHLVTLISSHYVPCVASHVVTLISSHCVPCVASHVVTLISSQYDT